MASRYAEATEVINEDEGKLGIGLTNTQERQLMEQLAELGGGALRDKQIKHEGKTLVLPEGMSNKEAIDFIKRHDEAMNEENAFVHQFRYRPLDGAVALQTALRKLFGTAGIPTGRWSFFFGKEPPKMITAAVGPTEKTQVPWGEINFPILEATIHTGSYTHRVYGDLFQLTVLAPKRHGREIAGLFRLVEAELQENSIYRGKAFDGQADPEFIDLEAIDPSQAIYSEEVEAQLEANIWSLLDYTRLHRSMKVPLKRAVLLEGPYGSGKTLAAFVTAIRASKADPPWTFIYCRPGRDKFENVMATARLYQPAIVFYEDVDTIASTAEDDPLSKLLDLFDGITAKGTEIMVVLTTNHKERIHKAMARPGRLDSIIAIGAHDVSGIRRMIQATVDPDLLADDIDYEVIGAAMEGFMPAFVKEAIDRATRYAIVRSGGAPERLATEDFVQAAHGLRPQLELQAKLQEGESRDSLEAALRKSVQRSVHGARLEDEDDDLVGVLKATDNGQ